MSYFDLLYSKYKKVTMTKKEVAEQLGVSVRTLDRMIENNDLPIASANPTGGKVLFPIRSFANYLEAMDKVA
jgi:excisionase family DNA binding protein